jgi:hypothetical protein
MIDPLKTKKYKVSRSNFSGVLISVSLATIFCCPAPVYVSASDIPAGHNISAIAAAPIRSAVLSHVLPTGTADEAVASDKTGSTVVSAETSSGQMRLFSIDASGRQDGAEEASAMSGSEDGGEGSAKMTSQYSDVNALINMWNGYAGNASSGVVPSDDAEASDQAVARDGQAEDADGASYVAEEGAGDGEEAVDEEAVSAELVSRDDIKYADHGVPILSIWLNGTTQEIIDSNDKTVKYPGNTVDVVTDGNVVMTQTDVEIKGRGNTTWGSPKKPYQIKFDTKQDLFGLGKAKKWVLLANYLDASHLRNDLAFSLGNLIGLDYSSNGVYLDLYVDGEYRGLYYLTAKLEINEAAVDLDSSYGVVVENDTVHVNGNDPTFRSATENSLIWLKDSGDKNYSTEAFAEFEKLYNKFERDVYEGNWTEINKDIDIDSFAKYYLLNEFAANQDTNHASFYMYRDGYSDVIHAGPVWDYDLAFCGLGEFYGDAYQLWVYNDRYNLPPITSKLITKLLDMPQFRQRVEEIYSSTVSSAINSLIFSIDLKSYAISSAIAADTSYWSAKDSDFARRAGSVENTARMKNWMIRRKAFIDYIYGNRVNNFSNSYVTLRNNAGYAGYKDVYPCVSENMSYSAKPYVFERQENGYYAIRQVATGLYLTDTNRECVEMDPSGVWEFGQVAVNGKECSLEEWTGKEGQYWMIYSDMDGSGSYRIINKNSSFFLSSDNNNRLVTTRWQSDSNQTFRIDNAGSMEELRKYFITHLYETCLGRSPEEGGMQAWQSQIRRGATGVQIMRGFIYSDEFKNLKLSDTEYVTALYAAVFGRKPDNDGLKAWVDVLEHGCSRDKVISGFAKSVEFVNLCRTIKIEVGNFVMVDIRDLNTRTTYFVDRLYRNCLGRKWDTDGLTAWVSALANKQITGSQLVESFFYSDEFMSKNMNNDAFIRCLYRTVFDRDADEEGRRAWMTYLNAGNSRSAVISSFTSSAEFVNLCNEAGILP